MSRTGSGIGAALVVALSVLISMAGAEESYDTAGSADLDLLSEVRRVAGKVTQIRGQAPSGAVAVRGDAEVRRAAADKREAAAIARARLDPRGRAWSDIGLGGGGSPKSLLERLAADIENVALDPGARRLLVDASVFPIEDFRVDGDDDVRSTVLLVTGIRPDEPLIAHGLMHLQQAARNGEDHLADTTDATLAGAALAEGEANLVALRYLFITMGLQDTVLKYDLDPGEVLEGRLLPSDRESAEGTVGSMLAFVYLDGYESVSDAYQAGGWKVVDRVLRERRTTRDVIHLDRAPLETVVEPSPGFEPPEGYALMDRDVVGEEGVVILVSLATGKDNLGMIAGDGWIGDALYRWERPGDPDGGITVWVSRWVSETEAADFDYSYGRVLAARFGADAVQQIAQDKRRVRSGGRTVILERRGAEVEVRVVPDDLAGAEVPPGAPAAR